MRDEEEEAIDICTSFFSPGDCEQGVNCSSWIGFGRRVMMGDSWAMDGS